MSKSIFKTFIIIIVSALATFLLTRWLTPKNNIVKYEQAEAQLLTSVNQIDSNVNRLINGLAIYGEILNKLNDEFELINEQQHLLIESGIRLNKSKKEELSELASQIKQIRDLRDGLIIQAKTFEL
jgi:uncharacterized membrane protein YhiD involved in acid resistance